MTVFLNDQLSTVIVDPMQHSHDISILLDLP
jgi:hypothetical protein